MEHWVAEGWCGVAEEEIYDEQGNGGMSVVINQRFAKLASHWNRWNKSFSIKMVIKSLYDLVESVYLYVYLNDEMKYKILPHCGWVKQSKLYYINTSIT